MTILRDVILVLMEGNPQLELAFHPWLSGSNGSAGSGDSSTLAGSHSPELGGGWNTCGPNPVLAASRALRCGLSWKSPLDCAFPSPWPQGCLLSAGMYPPCLVTRLLGSVCNSTGSSGPSPPPPEQAERCEDYASHCKGVRGLRLRKRQSMWDKAAKFNPLQLRPSFLRPLPQEDVAGL